MNIKKIQHKTYFKRIFGIILPVIFAFSSHFVFANNTQPKAAYYRYYSNGVATVSRTVTPTHIRRGYEVLDQNMYLIKKVPDYNVEKDLREEKQRAVQFERHRKDLQIKRSFRDVEYATRKKNDVMKVLNKQLHQQYILMKQLQTDRSKYLTAKAKFLLNKEEVPTSLESNIYNNKQHIQNTRDAIENLKRTISDQQDYYDYVIHRLQVM